MENYINQIVEDLRMAYEGAFASAQAHCVSDSGSEGMFEGVEEYLHGPRKPLSEIVGIEKIFLPPADLLFEKQAALLTREMTRLLAAYNFFPEFPNKLPEKARYRLLLDIWDSPQVFIKTGTVHLEFCHYDPEGCPFPKRFCHCQ